MLQISTLKNIYIGESRKMIGETLLFTREIRIKKSHKSDYKGLFQI